MRGLRLLIVASGSWGDVLPFAVLARAMERAGHKPTLAVPPIFVRPLRTVCRVHPVGIVPTAASVRAFQTSLEHDETAREGHLHYWRHILLPGVAPVLHNLATLGRFDVVLCHAQSPAGLIYARRLEVPCIGLSVGPGLIPNEGYPPASVAVGLRADQVLRRSSVDNESDWKDESEWYDDTLACDVRDVKRETGDLGWPSGGFGPYSMLDGFHKQVVCAPRFSMQGLTWKPGVVVAGYPYCDTPLASPPVIPDPSINAMPTWVVTLGTAMTHAEGGRYRRVVTALRSLGRRSINYRGNTWNR